MRSCMSLKSASARNCKAVAAGVGGELVEVDRVVHLREVASWYTSLGSASDNHPSSCRSRTE